MFAGLKSELNGLFKQVSTSPAKDGMWKIMILVNIAVTYYYWLAQRQWLTLFTLVFHTFSVKHAPESHRPTGAGRDNKHWERCHKDWKCVATILLLLLIWILSQYPMYIHSFYLKFNRTGQASKGCRQRVSRDEDRIFRKCWNVRAGR